MPLLIICSHCNHAVRNSDVSPTSRLCPHCSRALDPEVAAAPERQGGRKRRTRLVMTEPAAAPRGKEPKVPDPAPVADPTPEPVPSMDEVPVSAALVIEPVEAAPDRWAHLGRGATLIRAGFAIEWVAISVFVVILGAVLYLLALDPRAPASVRADAFYQEIRGLTPSLGLLLAAGLMVGGVFVAVGRVVQAFAPWDRFIGRGFRVTAACELLRFFCVVSCSGQAILVYMSHDAAGGRETFGAWVATVFALGLASRFVADLATVANFGLASAAVPSELLYRRAATIAVTLQLLVAITACVLAFAILSGTAADLVRSGFRTEPTQFVVPVAAVSVGFTIYTLLGVALQHAARRAAVESRTP